MNRCKRVGKIRRINLTLHATRGEMINFSTIRSRTVRKLAQQLGLSAYTHRASIMRGLKG